MTRHTMLHAEHTDLGATLVDFGGWDMPLWYPTGAIKEHLAVIRHAGLFDIGHMSGVMVSGSDALKLLQQTFTKDIKDLTSRAGYGAFLDNQGHVMDDAIIYPMTEGRYLVIFNVAKAPIFIDYFKKTAKEYQWTVDVCDLDGKYAKMDLQGPASVRTLHKVLADADDVFTSFPYFAYKGDIDFTKHTLTLKNGTPLFLSRTGYTGEQGFEIFVPQDKAVETWRLLLQAGEEFGLIPCGLAARDSLRTGAVLPLAQQDIGAWPFINHPWSFALPRDSEDNWTKTFNGREALENVLRATDKQYTLPYCGFDPRKVTTGEDHKHPQVFLDDECIGEVLTCVADVAVGRVDGKIVSVASPDAPTGFAPKGLVCGFLKVNRLLEAGTRVTLADARRKLSVEIVTDIRPDRTARKALMR